MSNLFYFFKSLVLTFVFVFVLQIRIGNQSLEDRALFWIHDSQVMVPLQEVAEGGVKILQRMWDTLTRGLQRNFKEKLSWETRPGERELIQIKRSAQYLMKRVQTRSDQENTQEQNQHQRDYSDSHQPDRR